MEKLSSDEIRAEIASRDEQITDLMQMIEDMKKETRDGRQESDIDKIERELRLLEDPYQSQRATLIRGNPPHIEPDDAHKQGQVLRWLNPKTREGRWMGWKIVKKDDPYIEQINKCIGEENADTRFDNDNLDDLVRRKDMVLGRLPFEYWNARQMKRELESMRQRETFNEEAIEVMKTASGSVKMQGGLKTDDNPRYVDKSKKTDSAGRTLMQIGNEEKNG